MIPPTLTLEGPTPCGITLCPLERVVHEFMEEVNYPLPLLKLSGYNSRLV
ncbi:MAG: hypothetical protein MUO24_03745 [Desulfobacterales bacterium]|nr:hypothetical protein [Desulfobacterales bacterium]